MSTVFATASLTALQNSLSLPAFAEAVVNITAAAQVPQLAQHARSREGLFVLGAGSNVVLPERIQATVARMQLKGVRLLESTPHAFLVEAAAGESWHGFVELSISQGWPGLENLALIPGTVGAAPVQNIGAYGVELCHRVHSVLAYDTRQDCWRELSRDDCAFSYRDSVFKRSGQGDWIITAVRFALPRQWRPILSYPDLQTHPLLASNPITPETIFQAICDIRRRKLPDPAHLPNAGSFFKNPVVPATQYAALKSRYPSLPGWVQPDGGVKLAAAWLIEQAGWKGRRLGPVGMHERHALVLVNHGGARARDVALLAHAVQRDVQARFQVVLEREPVSPR